MNVADFIVAYFCDKGVSEVFTITGGHTMFLNDAVVRNKKINYTCPHHEQTAAMAAEAYGRFTGKPAIALVTAGPGAINALNGVVGAWVDSSPLIVISGQSNLSIVQYAEKTNIRQFGVQGISIRKIVISITKYFVTVDDPAHIREYLDEAWRQVSTGRPGPVWIEVPIDIQSSEVPQSVFRLHEYVKMTTQSSILSLDIGKNAAVVYERIAKAQRPLFIFGQGVRLSGGLSAFEAVIKKIRIPLLTSRLGLDIIVSDHPLYCGRPGTYGERSANFAVQNADLIIVVGSRLTVSLTGHNVKDFGRNADKIIVDIDEKELAKPQSNIVLTVIADAKDFLNELANHACRIQDLERPDWLAICKNWQKRYPIVLPSYRHEKPVNSYYFTDRLSTYTPSGSSILVDTGSCFHVASQTWKIKKNQRFITTGGISTMGYWVASIGVCIATGRKSTIVITGDGSLQMNLQDLATVKINNLPLKIFIFNNNGYLLMRHTQRNYFSGRMIGEGPESGVWCPDTLKIAKAYGIKGVRISAIDQVDRTIKKVLTYDGPIICEVMTPEWQLIIPRVTSDRDSDGKMIPNSYENMFPFLSKEELKKNMIEKKL